MGESSLTVTRLYSEDDRIPDPNSPEKEQYNPSWPDIESAIRRLDGVHRSIVIIGKDDPEIDFMGIGGGANGLYRCFVVTAEGNEVTLLNPDESSDQIIDIFMGQRTKVLAKECLHLSVVLAAAQSYAQNSQMNPALLWQER